jgi:putative acetyltransferase
LKIRLATTKDHASTRHVVDLAFRPEDVVSFLEALRIDGCIIDEWVAEEAGEIIGHIVFSRAWIETPKGERLPAANLTPLAVHPDYQNRGIGTALMNHALAALDKRGETLFLVLGHPNYYPRVGFSAKLAEKLESPWKGNPAFMAKATSAPEGELVLPDPILKVA